VEASGSFGREPPGELDRVTALERHGVAPAFGEPNRTPVQHVDRGYDLHLIA
jgi:hypothetical protein